MKTKKTHCSSSPLKKGDYRGFTLVELIVVITILAILATIGFISISGYSQDARNSSRASDVKTIEKSLQLYSTVKNKYPDPQDAQTVSYSGDIVYYQGIFGDTPYKELGNLSNIPLDPLTEEKYIYSITVNKTQYEILAIYEGEIANNAIPNQVHAAETYKPKVTGTYNKIFVKTPNFYIPLPSLINAELTNTGITLDDTNIKSQIVTNGNNLPQVGIKITQSTGAITDLNLRPYFGTLTSTSSDDQKANLAKQIQEAYSGSSLETQTIYANILSKTGTGELANLVNFIVLGNGANNTVVQTTNDTSDTSWCPYSSTAFTDALGWTNSDIKYNETTSKCYVFGDEDTNSISACNKWITDNISTSVGDFIWVPARHFIDDGANPSGTNLKDSVYQREVIYNGNIYVCRGFAVAKYEMSYDETIASNSSSPSRDTRAYNSSKTPVSMANRLSVVDITQPNAIAQCQSIGAHLITNNEWMAIARNIEAQDTNWSSGSVGNGYIDNGLDNKLTPNTNGTIGCFDDDETYADTTGAGACENERQLSLSNGEKIWDLAGNVREHVNKANTIDGINYNSSSFSLSNACGGNGWYSFNNNETITPAAAGGTCAYANGYTQANYGPAGTTYTSDEGMGRIYSYNTTNNIFLRGANADGGTHGGLFTLNLDWDASSQHYNVGFRCSW